MTTQEQLDAKTNFVSSTASPIVKSSLKPSLSPRVSPKSKARKEKKIEREWISLHPQAKFFSVHVDKNKGSIDKDFEALLKLHARGLPLMVARFVTGPLVTLSIKDAVTLIDFLKYTKRFLPRKLIPILPGLRAARREEKISDLLTSVSKTDSKEKTQKVGLVEVLGRKNRNKDLAAKTAKSYRKRIFAPLPDQIFIPMSESSRRQISNEDFLEKLGLVGYRTENGSFYTGFFSRRNFVFSKKITIEQKCKITAVRKSVFDFQQQKYYKAALPSTPYFPFLTRGKFDADGNYHPYFLSTTTENLLFPSLDAIVQQQSRDPLASTSSMRMSLIDELQLRRSGNFSREQANPWAEPFQFCFQNGTKVKLSELLGTGIWHLDEADEYFVGGIFNYEGTFVAAYFLSMSGFLIPGTSDKERRFVPTCRYNFDCEKLMMQDKALHEDLIQELMDIEKVIVLPKAEELRTPAQTKWVCVKDAVIMMNPLSITILSDAFFGEKEDINVYAGGELGVDGQLYLYGKYKRNGTFVPGALSLTTEKGLVEIYKDKKFEETCAETFYEKYGVELNSLPQITRSGNKIAPMWETLEVANTSIVQETNIPLTQPKSPNRKRTVTPAPERKLVIKRDLPSLGLSTLQGEKIKMKEKKKPKAEETQNEVENNNILWIDDLEENINPIINVSLPEPSPEIDISINNVSEDELLLLTSLTTYVQSDEEQDPDPIREVSSEITTGITDAEENEIPFPHEV